METPVAPVGVPAASAGIDHHLASIRDAHDRIRRGDNSAIPAYNHSVARLIEHLEASGADPWGAPLPISGAGGIKILRGRAPAGTEPVHDQLFPADTLTFRGEFAGHEAKAPGIGAPLVLVTSFDGIGHQEIIPIHTPLPTCGANSTPCNASFPTTRTWSSSATAWAASSAA